MWPSQAFSKQATNYICQKRLIQDHCTGQYLKHSPVQTADNVGMLLVLEDQDLIHSSFLVLLLTIYFLYGHLKGHWRPLTGESCGMRSQQTCSESFWSEGARLCQTAPNCPGMGHQSTVSDIPPSGATYRTHGQRHLALEALEKWSLIHHPQSSNNILCSYNLLRQPQFITTIINIHTHFVSRKQF